MGMLDGKIAIITGAARGQGAEEARLFAAEGATVFATDVLEDEGRTAAVACGAAFLRHDVTVPEQWQGVIGHVLGAAGRIDILVNNAAVLYWQSITETTMDAWARTVAVNQTGVFLGVQSVAVPMMRQRSGSIVNVASVSGLRSASRSFAYGVTKWAVRGITRSAAQEFGPFGIRVNAVVPGVVDTAMMAGQPIGEIGARTPLGRYATPAEVADMVLWVASDRTGYSTGSDFLIDGGLMA